MDVEGPVGIFFFFCNSEGRVRGRIGASNGVIGRGRGCFWGFPCSLGGCFVSWVGGVWLRNFGREGCTWFLQAISHAVLCHLGHPGLSSLASVYVH